MLAQRKEFGYPPYARMIDFILQDSFEQRLNNLSMLLSERLGRTKAGTLLGPFSPSVDKITGRHIRIIRLSLARNKSLQSTKDALHKLVADFESYHKWSGHISIDVDPL